MHTLIFFVLIVLKHGHVYTAHTRDDAFERHYKSEQRVAPVISFERARVREKNKTKQKLNKIVRYE